MTFARLAGFLSVALAVFCAPAFADRLQPVLKEVPAVITGTLSPFLLSINGEVVSQKKTGVHWLKLNGRLIETGAERNHPFFRQTSEENLAFSVGDQVELRTIRLPEADSAAITGRRNARILIRVMGAKSVRIDGHPVPVSGEWVSWILPKKAHWTQVSHSLELDGGSKGSVRLYNLSFRELTEPIVRNHSLELGTGQLMGASGNAFRIAYSNVFGSEWTDGIGIQYGSAPIPQSIGLTLLAGHQFFRADARNRSAYLEPGAFIRILGAAQSSSPPGSSGADHADSSSGGFPMGISPGLYLRSEPLSFGAWGLSFRTELLLPGYSNQSLQAWETELYSPWTSWIELSWHL